eukprot:m.29952 g.29952  ORF g.29952 m.29952 type:complete len:130 (-) comp10564_c0_seq1:2560-2949(-)
MSSFKEQYPLQARIEQAQRIKQKYSDRIPVIAEKFKKSNLPDIEKKKYLLPEDLTVNQFHYVIRQRVKLMPDQALFTYVMHEKTPGKPKPILPSATSKMGDIYQQYQDEDGFLYMIYANDDVYGSSEDK